MIRSTIVMLFLMCSITVFSQEQSIKGVVQDDEGEPIAAATVQLLGHDLATSTSLDGTFSLSIPQGITDPQLEISLIGYKLKVVNIAGQTELRISLEQDDANVLEEVVAVGYGNMRKADLTGSVGTVSGEELANRGTTSVMSALQGTVPGVDISSNSTKPGGGFSIQIRGQNSLQGGSPLYVVDGVVTSNIDFLNPADIAQIDVLKDASSTAIYGSRGSNGVVIVKTKNAGKPGSPRTTVTYDGYYGVRQLARIPDFMSGREWVDFRTSAFYTYGTNGYQLSDNNKASILQNSPLLEQRLYNESYEDWLGLGTRVGQQQNHYVGISAATEKLNYNLGVGYQNEEGNFLKENLDRYNVKLSVEQAVSDKVSVGAGFNMVHGVNNFGSQYGYRDILRMPSILYAYDEAGDLIPQPGIASAIQGSGNFTSSPNPLLEIESGTQEIRQFDVLGNIFAEYKPIENLTFRSTFLPRFNRTRVGTYYGVVTGTRNQDVASQDNGETFEWTWDNVLTYDKQLNDDHRINASLIQSAYKTRQEGIIAQANTLPYPGEWYNLFSGTFVPGMSSTAYTETSLLSYAARVNYDYKGRYLLTGTVRYDGSSKLRDRWAAFPSAAFAWRISEESFLENASFLNDLKIRTSLGYSGNNNGISAFATILSPETGSLVWYDYNGDAVTGFLSGRPINPVITWEKTREVNLGLDFALFNNRVRGNIDFYDKLSDGLLMQRTLTVESGVSWMMDNIGSVNNKGVEIGLNTTNIQTQDWDWSTSFMFASNKNAIRSLYGRKEDVPGESRFIGQPINVTYDYKIIGLWQSSQAEEAAALGQQPGQAIAADIDGNGSISPADRTILGSEDPNWIGSVTSNLRYKNWDFSFNVYTRQGVFVTDRFLEEFGPANNQRGRPKIRYDYYIPADVPRYDWNNWGTDDNGNPKAVWGTSGAGNEDAKYPHPQNVGPYYGNNGKYTDASFFKVRNIILGYTLPTEVVSKWKMSQFRVYANVLNPFVFTKYQGWDPEYATTSLAEGNGPSNITYQLGVNVRF